MADIVGMPVIHIILVPERSDDRQIKTLSKGRDLFACFGTPAGATNDHDRGFGIRQGFPDLAEFKVGRMTLSVRSR